MFFRNKISYHNHLVNQLTVLQYRNVGRGVCYGLAAAGLQAILLRDTESFDNRIRDLYKIKPAILPYHIQLARNEWKSKKYPALNTLSDKTRLLLELSGFFDTVAIYQGPQDYSQWFPKAHEVRHQQPLTELKMVLPEKLKKEGGLCITANFSGAYTVHELYKIFSSLRTQLKKHHADYPVGFMLANMNHAFTIGYDPAINKWMLIEADQGPTQFYNDFALSRKINALFSKNKITVCNTKIYLTKKNEEHALKVMNDWKMTPEFQSANQITPERIQYRDSNHASMLYSAAQCGLTETVRELLTSGLPISIHKSDAQSPSPLHIASYHGDVNVVKVLLEHGADVNKDIYFGRTPIAVAAHHRHVDVVKLLLKYHADILDIIHDEEMMQLLSGVDKVGETEKQSVSPS